ncbi:uncharacterized protein LOC124815778 [Hydra vulgaris]|uniref:uncharacterized protein LOC124815778 n=1 Tax=Hydra vulgaris TaxID=6087 RepID=UPI0032E9F915
MKAVKVTCNGESKIVVATSNDLNAFMANICSTFNVPNISNLKWLGCAVNTLTFPAVICEQSKTLTIQKEIKLILLSIQINTSPSIPLLIINKKLIIKRGIEGDVSQSSLKNYSACSTTSLTNISIETESGTKLVADSSSCNRPQITKRKIELQKNKPSTQVLAILNRNLFEPQIFKSIPIRLQLTPSLLISEFCRLYPMFADFESNSKEFCNLVFSDGSVFLNLIKFQSDVSCKKSSSNAFHVTQSDNLDEMLGVSIPGPQVVFNETHFMICSRNGCELKKAQISSASEVFCCIIAIYYLMELTYPSSYAQTLGVLQEIILKDTFLHKSHKATNYLKKYGLLKC